MRQTVAICLTLLLGAAAPAAAEDFLDAIAAQVGSDVVLVSEVEQMMKPVEARLREMGASELEIVRMRADALERLIEQRLIAQLARRAEIEASDAEIDQAIAGIAQETGLTVEDVRARVEAEGLPFEGYRMQLAEQIVHQKVLGGMVQSRIRIDEAEIRRLYRARYDEQHEEGEEAHVRQLLVVAEGRSPAARDAACARARRARSRIAAGEPFERLAKQLSAVNPEAGGDLGWLHVEDLAGWMAPVVAGLEPGGVSDVVETPFGCNLLQLVERRQTKPVSYEEARPTLHAEIFDQRFADEYLKFLEKLRERTYIERRGMFAEAARLGGAGPAAAPPPAIPIAPPPSSP